MVNCNPETVSTDYDTSNKLYFEPLTVEDVVSIYEKEKPLGVIVQFGGQTPLKLARDLEAAGVPIIGTSPDSIDRAEDRERFQQMLHQLKLLQPPNRTARTEDQAFEGAKQIGYPVIVRPPYLLGGRAMEIVHAESDLKRYMREAVKVSNVAEPMEALRKNHVLVDGKDEKYMLQIFMLDAGALYGDAKAGPFFYELIQREGDKGFGYGNFRALFESIEREQQSSGRS